MPQSDSTERATLNWEFGAMSVAADSTAFQYSR